VLAVKFEEHQRFSVSYRFAFDLRFCFWKNVACCV